MLRKRATTTEDTDGDVEVVMLGESSEDKGVKAAKPVSVAELLRTDLRAVLVLVVLYTIQGAPLGLALGAIPMLLKRTVSFTAMGLFSFASYPYSLKVLWAPIVDSLFVARWGRRKTWIIPMQLTAAALFWFLSHQPSLLDATAAVPDPSVTEDQVQVGLLASMFFVLVLATATQDIAVDGWALSILKPRNRVYASTCQSVGLNIGYFSSFTVFLALHSAEFCNKYLRSVPVTSEGIMTVASVLQLISVVYVVVTIALFFIHEQDDSDAAAAAAAPRSPWRDITEAYTGLYRLMCLPAVLRLSAVLLTVKIGYRADDTVTALKLLEKGFRVEDLALVAVIAFPCTLLFAAMAGRWSSGPDPFHAFRIALQARFALVLCNMTVVWMLPEDGSGGGTLFYLVVVVLSLAVSFCDSIMFVCMGAFFSRVADPTFIGGTYLTVLNTLSNMGGQWPKYFILRAVDIFTIKETVEGKDGEIHERILRDGYYIVNLVSLVVGVLVFWLFVAPSLRALANTSVNVWRVAS